MAVASQRVDVVVVGAGVAGLACAAALAPLRVVVLEASEAVGGRVRRVCVDGVGVEAGAAWVHGTKGNPLMEFVGDRLIPVTARNPRLEPSLEEHHVLWGDGRGPVSPEEYGDGVGAFRAAARVVADKAGACFDDTEAAGPVIRAAVGGVDPRSRPVVEFLFWQEANWNGVGLGALPLACFQSGEGEDGEEGDYPGPHCSIAGGMYGVVADLAAGVDVVTNCPVVRIVSDASGVVVHVDGDTPPVHCRAAVVTASVGVLASGLMSFEPPLPSAKVEAVARLRMGNDTKVMLWFETVFWPPGRPYIGILWPSPPGDGRPQFRLFVDYHHIARQPVLVAFVCGEDAAAAAAMSAEDVQAAAVAALQAALPGVDVPAPKATHVTRWHAEPWIRGSYTYPALGSSYEDHDALAQHVPDAHLFFAGEATDAELMGSVPGALLTGRRAAAAVRQHLAVE